MSPSPRSQAAPLGQRAASGFAWLFAQAVTLKAASVLAQVLLAWFLAKSDFGLIGLAYTVSAFANLVQQAGLREILLHRHRHFDRWATAAFWMSVVSGLLAGAAMAAAAPLAARAYHEPRLTGLILVLAASAPLAALSVVPTAALEKELRFGELARIGLWTGVATSILSVLAAWGGMGAYSFVLPAPVVATAKAAVVWAKARPPVLARLHVARWRYLLGDSAAVFVSGVLTTLTMQGDYLVLGLLYPAAVVGTYVFAFNLSMQAASLLTANLNGVLLPALSKLQAEPDRQRQAFLRAVRVLAAVGMPVCFLQAVVADPALRLLFGGKWADAIPILQVLSVNMALGPANPIAVSLLQARGQFRLLLRVSALAATLYAALVVPGAVLGAGLGVAVGGTVVSAITGGVIFWLAIRPLGGGLKDLARTYPAPLAASAGAAGAGWAAGRVAGLAVPAGPWHFAAELVAAGLTLPCVYVIFARILLPDACHELASRMADLWHRVGRARAGSHRAAPTPA